MLVAKQFVTIVIILFTAVQGFVVGFMGSRVLSLNGIAMTAVDVPHSGCMYQYLEKKMFK